MKYKKLDEAAGILREMLDRLTELQKKLKDEGANPAVQELFADYRPILEHFIIGLKTATRSHSKKGGGVPPIVPGRVQ